MSDFKPAEYDAEAIDRALAGLQVLNSRDAVGHGTLTAGLAAGNGRAIRTSVRSAQVSIYAGGRSFIPGAPQAGIGRYGCESSIFKATLFFIS